MVDCAFSDRNCCCCFISASTFYKFIHLFLQVTNVIYEITNSMNAANDYEYARTHHYFFYSYDRIAQKRFNWVHMHLINAMCTNLLQSFHFKYECVVFFSRIHYYSMNKKQNKQLTPSTIIFNLLLLCLALLISI